MIWFLCFSSVISLYCLPFSKLSVFVPCGYCLNWKIYCDDHSSLSSTTAVQKWIISYILHIWGYSDQYLYMYLLPYSGQNNYDWKQESLIVAHAYKTYITLLLAGNFSKARDSCRSFCKLNVLSWSQSSVGLLIWYYLWKLHWRCHWTADWVHE